MIVNSVGVASINYGFVQEETDTAGKEDFLRLLITQMQMQDPLAPVKNEDFIAQLAQFNSLEQMINLNDSLEAQLVIQTLSSASNLIGREVDAWTTSDSSVEEVSTFSGTVQEVWLEEGAVVLSLGTDTGNVNVLLGDVIRVR